MTAPAEPVPDGRCLVTAPNACVHCGIEQQNHMQRWVLGVGWHQWAEPPDSVRKQRMLARREARIARQS